jgi:hypothetical protein
MKEKLEKTRVILGCQNRFGMNVSLEGSTFSTWQKPEFGL